MLNNAAWDKVFYQAFYVLCIIGFVGLWIGPSVVSIATGLMALITLFKLPAIYKENRAFTAVMAAFVLIVLSDFFRGGDFSIVRSKLMLVSGLAFMHLGMRYFLNQRHERKLDLVLIVAVVVVFVNLHSLYTYWNDSERYNRLLLQSKAIPILNMHHIHFGIINGLTLLTLIGAMVRYTLKYNYRLVFTALALIIAISFHVLSSRTGLLGFYSGGIVAAIYYGISTKEYRRLAISFGILSTVIVTSFFLVKPFQNKVYNSIEDVKSWGGSDINYKSMGMRFEAYRMCVALIKESPFSGVGSGEMDRAIQKEYVGHTTVLEPINRVGPHNQFLEFGVKYGVWGILLVLAYFLVQIKGVTKQSYIYMGIVVALFAAMQFESLLERQTSIYATVFFSSLGWNMFRE